MTLRSLVTTGTKNWPAFGRVVALVAAVTAVPTVILGSAIVVVIVVIGRTFHVRPSQIALGGAGGILLQTTQGSDDRLEYLVLVNPHGWERTAIVVQRGDTVLMTAQGHVQISAASLVRSSEARRVIERRWLASGRIRPEIGQTPEDLFPDSLTTAQRDSIVPDRPWIGPGGDTGARLEDHRYPGRTGRKIMPDQPYGALVAGIVPMDRDSVYHPRFIGRDTVFVAPESGRLWFTVNDVQHPLNLFFLDNLGAFLVRVQIHRP